MLTNEGEHIIIETKGIKDVDVEHKDRRIRLWCEDATNIIKSKWSFIRVDQADFERYRFKSIKELVSVQRG